MSQWKVREGLEFVVEMDDVEFQEKYENAFEKMAEVEKELQKVGKMSEISKGYCKMFWDLFDNIFGEGAAEKIFEGKMNTTLCENVYDSFIECCEKDAKRISANRQKIVSKYRPKKGKK